MRLPDVASTTDTVSIHYRRLPDREDVYVQQLIARSDDCVVTLMPRTPLHRSIVVDGRVILENDSPVVWFTFEDTWHDIGLFHTADGRFTGTYSNILTPVRFIDPLTWETTDLFLDVWLDPSRKARVLDRDELEAAVANGTIDGEMAGRAHAEASRLVRLAARGSWPPPIVAEWPLRRALEKIGGG